jgi:hypothetical protein
VPITVKMPEPMTAPMPREVRLSQPRDFFNRTSAFSESDRSWSILLQLKSWEATRTLRSHRELVKAPCRIRCVVRESVPQCTLRGDEAQLRLLRGRFATETQRKGPDNWLHLGELGVALYEFFGAAAGEAYGQAAVVVLAFHAYYCAYAVFGVADFLA